MGIAVIDSSSRNERGPACSTRIAIKGNAPNPSHVPDALTPYAAQSHPNCRPSDRLATMLSATLAIWPGQPHVDQRNQSV